MTDVQLLTTRETIATLLNEDPGLRDLGLPEDAILQADTVSSPEMRPFGVIRWMDAVAGIGPVTRRPFTVWWYDEDGDYSRIDKLSARGRDLLESQGPIATFSGVISQIQGSPNTSTNGLGRGPDLYDDGYKCVVIPWRFQAIATGV
jgi:hypothetical protein